MNNRTHIRLPVQIQFQGLPVSEALEDAIHRRVSHLSQFCDDIMRCRVVVRQLQRHQHQGRPFNVSVDLTIAGRELVANRAQHEDVYVALREAFDDMRRQLEDAVRLRRREAPVPPPPP